VREHYGVPFECGTGIGLCLGLRIRTGDSRVVYPEFIKQHICGRQKVEVSASGVWSEKLKE
jgi:hypothetical protein